MQYSTNKIKPAVMFMLTTAGLALVSSCGGGGGGGSTEVIDSTLDTASVETLAGRVVLEGDCVGVSGIADLSQVDALRVASHPASMEQPSTLASRVSDYTDQIYGLISGTFTKTGDHENGTDTLVYTYSDYTNPVGDLVLQANGSASVVYHGEPTELGPVVSNKTVSTNGPVSIAKTPNISIRPGIALKSNASYELSVSGLNQIYAAVLSNPDDLVVNNVTLKNLDTGQVYTVTNLQSKGSFGSSQVTLSDLSYTYTSTDVGTLQITSDNVVINLDGMKIPSDVAGTFTMTATDGSKGELVIQSNGNITIYTGTGPGRVQVSEVDCSGLVH